jgi:glycine/D-amino acid oxidase-like deaminating enzyme
MFKLRLDAGSPGLVEQNLNFVRYRAGALGDSMSKFTEKAAAALELLPEEMREPAVAYILEQAEKLRVLKAEIQLGLDDEAAGRVHPWDFADFLRRARETHQVRDEDHSL